MKTVVKYELDALYSESDIINIVLDNDVKAEINAMAFYVVPDNWEKGLASVCNFQLGR
ncbi:MAG: hypothetical protein ACYDEI_00020 [Erysipelotrichaceae bacterium]